jgi:hypothetical protein
MWHDFSWKKYLTQKSAFSRPSTFKSEEAEEVLASSSGQMSLPKISAGFSLQGLVDQDAFDDIPEIKNLVQSVVTASNEECIDLCDSD